MSTTVTKTKRTEKTVNISGAVAQTEENIEEEPDSDASYQSTSGTNPVKPQGGTNTERKPKPKQSKNAVESEDEEPPCPCGKCDKIINDDDQSLKCEICDQYFHIECEGVNPTLYKTIKAGTKPKESRARIHWYCGICDRKSMGMLTKIIHLDDKQRDLENQVKNLDEIKADKADLKKLEDRVGVIESKQKALTDAEPKPGTSSSSSASAGEMMKEFEDRKERVNNAVFFNVPESKATTMNDKVKHDQELLKQIGEICEEPIIYGDVVKIVRIGKIGEKPRAMLVTFTDEEKKRKLFRNLQKLREGPENMRMINGQHDLTPQQRDEEKKLREEAREKEEHSGEYSYRVRGPTWARRIVQIDKVPAKSQQQQS